MDRDKLINVNIPDYNYHAMGITVFIAVIYIFVITLVIIWNSAKTGSVYKRAGACIFFLISIYLMIPLAVLAEILYRVK